MHCQRICSTCHLNSHFCTHPETSKLTSSCAKGKAVPAKSCLTDGAKAFLAISGLGPDRFHMFILNPMPVPAALWQRGESCLLMRNREEGKRLLTACWPLLEAQSGLMMSCTCRQWTLSIAVPGSIIDNTQTFEQATAIAGQLARAAAIFNVDEVRQAVCQLPAKSSPQRQRAITRPLYISR